MTGRFSYITRILQPEGVMYVRVFGVSRPDLSRDRGGMLLDRVAKGGINAVIFDYRRMLYTHDAFQIGTLAGRVASLRRDPDAHSHTQGHHHRALRDPPPGHCLGTPTDRRGPAGRRCPPRRPEYPCPQRLTVLI